MALRRWIRSASCATTSKAPSLTAGGVHQWSRSKGSPFLKKTENCPPSGPSQKRSSPPKEFMCGLLTPDERASRPIQPKLSPSGPAAVLVMTRPWMSGLTATWAWPPGPPRTTTLEWASRKARSSLNRTPSGALAGFAQAAARTTIRIAAPMPYLMDASFGGVRPHYSPVKSGTQYSFPYFPTARLLLGFSPRFAIIPPIPPPAPQKIGNGYHVPHFPPPGEAWAFRFIWGNGPVCPFTPPAPGLC